MTPATRQEECKGKPEVLHLSFELGRKEWKLAFTVARSQKPRIRTVPAGDLAAVKQEIALARQRFDLAEKVRVVSCYEAGRDGFWLHRFLTSIGVDNVVVDSSSIEVNRRARQAKTDGLDVQRLLSLLLRYHDGESQVWSVVRVPSVEQEDGRQLSRDWEVLKKERTLHRNRLQALLASQGASLDLKGDFAERLETLTMWDGSPLPADLKLRLKREWERLELVEGQIRELKKQREEKIAEGGSVAMRLIQQLVLLRAIGTTSAWVFVQEFFGWRQFRNRREIGALAGLSPMPYRSGESLNREQGISKSGNVRLRTMAIEIAWAWLRYQPQSQLSLWFQERYRPGTRRSRRVGIVAVARKLLVALWRYLETGVIPEGAALKSE
ncbi:MAG: transposase [Acidobacteriota bacterium]|jgi:transposase|nr:transposase [Acidobacteriota bacterium]